ncbi:hypothetical protein I203_102300 [Kwoniella mangroviensis CBS 8507]|uniref:uncharacterized protein n=1 Tax=Kwoniella mangroviensis CBS 8507 TaxID=1296122 RepID=UPI00080CDD7A|nr:uncharacterized protein I203_03501 [Kwoniella mangroviensis CBS 8507]OCF67803.1 hypothetical protein I203_03501 [Kwoniella mangroviensis CBS 8507]
MSSSIESRATDLLPRIASASGMWASDQSDFRDAVRSLGDFKDYFSGCSQNDMQYFACKAAQGLSLYGDVPPELARRARGGYDETKVSSQARDLERSVQSIVSIFADKLSGIDLRQDEGLKRDINGLIEDACRIQFGREDESTYYDNGSFSDDESFRYSSSNSGRSSDRSSWSSHDSQSSRNRRSGRYSDSFDSRNSAYSAPPSTAAAA